MKIKLLAICFLAYMFATATERKITVMTYNVRAASLTTLDSLAAEIASYTPDFVALQEIDVMTQRTNAPQINGKNMVSELASRTGMFGYFARTLNFAGGYYGIAILSKHPSITIDKFMLPNPMQTEQRAMLRGLFEIDGNDTICFVCTHLDVKSAETRLLQTDFILDKLNDASMPTILGGDMNARPDEACIANLKEKMTDISGTEYTFPADKPNRKIDYLFAMPSDAFTLLNTEVIGETRQLSDHRPIVTTLLLK